MRRLTVYAKPGSSIDRVLDIDNDQYVVYTKEKAHAGRANNSILLLLSKHFSIKKHQLKIVFGKTSREKIIEIQD